MKKKTAVGAPIRKWVTGHLPNDVKRQLNRLTHSDDVHHVAVMPDVHLAREICIGTAFATSELIYPDAVGGDLGCGMAAVAIDAGGDALRDPSQRVVLLKALRLAVPIHRQRAETGKRLRTYLPEPSELSDSTLRILAQNQGAHQLGTLGTGNHFLELQRDEDETLWLMVHSGSRGMGQAIRARHIDQTTKSCTGLKFLSRSTIPGEAYLRDLQWARQYATSNRRCMLQTTSVALETLFGWRIQEDSIFDCDHNHINAETHFGSELLVHRKGAMAAFRGQHGIVPGSMASQSYHVEGRGLAEALCSSAHGAGRAMSRTEARRRITRSQLASDLADVHVDSKMLNGLREEAPSAYKDIGSVMRTQRKLVRIVRQLTPILTHKGFSTIET